MTNAPERLWATPLETVHNRPSWIDEIEVSHPESFGGFDQTGVEYVRADLVPQWQPIAENTPKEGTPVLVGWVNSFLHPIVAHKEGRLWGVLGLNMEFTALQVNPTHWMPLQKGPNE